MANGDLFGRDATGGKRVELPAGVQPGVGMGGDGCARLCVRQRSRLEEPLLELADRPRAAADLADHAGRPRVDLAAKLEGDRRWIRYRRRCRASVVAGRGDDLDPAGL